VSLRKRISDTARNPDRGPPAETTDARSESNVLLTFALYAGIFLIPYVFAWFTLGERHGTLARVISFTWMIITIAALVTT
jgi:hypothetical protein